MGLGTGKYLIMAPRKEGRVKRKYMSCHFFVPLVCEWEDSMTCSGRNHLPCLCCLDGAQSLLHHQWSDLDFLARILASCSWMIPVCLCSHMANFSSGKAWYADGAPDLDGTCSLPNVNCLTFAGDFVLTPVFRGSSSMTEHRKLETFLGRRPTILMMYSDSALPTRLKMGLTEGKNATEILF